jgi:hypothetical protein
VPDTVGNRSNLDLAHLLDETGVDGFAIERLETAAEGERDRQGSGGACAVKPRH